MNSTDKNMFMSFLMRFKPEELPNIIEDCFFKVSWDQMKLAALKEGVDLKKIRQLALLFIRLFEVLNISLHNLKCTNRLLSYENINMNKNVVTFCHLL